MPENNNALNLADDCFFCFREYGQNEALKLIPKTNTLLKKELNGCNLLMIACYGFMKIHGSDATLPFIEFLLNHGFDPNEKDNDGDCAMHQQSFLDKKTINALLLYGGNPNIVNNNGATPLMMAAQEQNEAAVETLISAGASVKCLDKFGYSAVTYCCRGSLGLIPSERIIKMLIFNGANYQDLYDENCYFYYIDQNLRTGIVTRSRYNDSVLYDENYIICRANPKSYDLIEMINS